MEDITEGDEAHGKGWCKGFRIRSWEEYHDLHVQGNVFCKLMCLKVFKTCV